VLPREAFRMLGWNFFFENQHVWATVGCSLMLTKTLVIVGGLQLLRHASLVEEGGKIKVAGMVLAMGIGPLIEICAYACAPQALLAPINGFDVVWNICLAPCTLGESLNQAKIAGTILVFLGATTAPAFGPHSRGEEDLETLRDIFLSWRFFDYAVVCLSLLAAGVLTLQSRKQNGPDTMRGVVLALGGGAIAGQNYFLSASATLFPSSADAGDWRVWADWLPWFTIGGAVACAVVNAVLLNKSLVESEATFIVPLFAGSAITASCISAAVVMQETADLAFWRLAGYWFGITLVISGLFVLARDSRSTTASAPLISQRDAEQSLDPEPANENSDSSRLNIMSIDVES